MNGAINEHTEALIGELMRSLKIQEELLRELSKITSAVMPSGKENEKIEQSFNKAVMRWKGR